MLKTIMIAVVVAVMAMAPFQGIAEAGKVTRVAQVDASDILDLVNPLIEKPDDDDDDGVDYDECDRLKAKAKRTGSKYWWKQYRRCRDD